ncbi:hypothetical protein HSTV2_54 [Halorubrum sodomense tailed virus 2]|uniref:Uncharacterized protein n=1 Tax=Halorubrum sodomense tailed virus 2 TaxID=1262527 RepID=L7TIV5_9CAUD|nr:hypothetical protein HSTV2_54 [Halorubrum sodomense tailed virus 2]AGC34323.1 hypothetical protein HSTV2_54 [Halorubrum sodomense tailed virus 2]
MSDDLDSQIREIERRIEAEIERNQQVLDEVGEFDPRSIRARQAEQFFRGERVDG